MSSRRSREPFRGSNYNDERRNSVQEQEQPGRKQNLNMVDSGLFSANKIKLKNILTFRFKFFTSLFLSLLLTCLFYIYFDPLNDWQIVDKVGSGFIILAVFVILYLFLYVMLVLYDNLFTNKVSDVTKDMNVNPNGVSSHLDGIVKVLIPTEDEIKKSAEKAKAAKGATEVVENRYSRYSR